MRHEDIGVHDGDQLVQEVRLVLKQLWRQLLHHLLKSLSCHRGNSIPSLGFTPGDDREVGSEGERGKVIVFHSHFSHDIIIILYIKSHNCLSL